MINFLPNVPFVLLASVSDVSHNCSTVASAPQDCIEGVRSVEQDHVTPVFNWDTNVDTAGFAVSVSTSVLALLVLMLLLVCSTSLDAQCGRQG